MSSFNTKATMDAGLFDLKQIESSPISYTPIFDLWLQSLD